ncbi:hypothetical protein D3C77_73750 [compost metagenome]
MISLPDELPDDPVLLKQLLLEALARQAKTAEVLQAHEGHIVDLKEQIKLLRDRWFGRKSEQAVELNTPHGHCSTSRKATRCRLSRARAKTWLRPRCVGASASRCRLTCRCIASSRY